MTHSYRNDLNAPWLEAALYDLYAHASADDKLQIEEALNNFRESIENNDPAEGTTPALNEHVHLRPMDLIYVGRAPLFSNNTATPNQLTRAEFELISDSFSKPLKSLLMKFYANDPEFFYLRDGEIYSEERVRFNVDDADGIVIDFDGNGLFNSAVDLILTRKTVSLPSGARTLWVKNEQVHGMQTVAGLLGEYKRTNNRPITGTDIAEMIEALPSNAPHAPEITQILAWYDEVASRMSSPPTNLERLEYKRAVMNILLLAQKGYGEAIASLLWTTTESQWEIIYSEPELAIHLPESLRLSAKTNGKTVRDSFAIPQGTALLNPIGITIQTAKIPEFQKGSQDIDRYLETCEQVFAQGELAPPGLLLMTTEGLTTLVDRSIMTTDQEARARSVIVDFMTKFKGYSKSEVTIDFKQRQIDTEDAKRSEAQTMDLNHDIVFSAFYVLVRLDDEASIEAALKFNEAPLDANWNQRDNYYVEYFKRVAADEVYRYLAGDKKGLYADLDLDIFNQWGREIQRNAEFRTKLEQSGYFNAKAIIAAQDPDQKLSKNYVVLHLLRHASEKNEDWRNYDEDKIKSILATGYPDDYDPSAMDTLLIQLSDDDKSKLEALAEKYKGDISLDVFQEGIDQTRLHHYLYDVEECRLRVIENDFNRQAWTWGVHGKLLPLFQGGADQLSSEEILAALHGLKESDFNHLLPSWAYQFTESKYSEEIRAAAFDTVKAARLPQWWLNEKFGDDLPKQIGMRRLLTFPRNMPDPWRETTPLKVHHFLPPVHGTPEDFDRLMAELQNPSPFRPKDYRRISKLMIRSFGEDSIDVFLMMIVTDAKINTPNWPVFGYIFDNVIINSLGTKTVLNNSMSGFVSHASSQGGNKMAMNLFNRATINWLDTGIDRGEFIRTFMDEYNKGELGETLINTGFNETRRTYAIRGLKTYRLHALAEISSLMDEIESEIKTRESEMRIMHPDDWSEVLPKEKEALEKLYADLLALQSEVAFD